MPLILTCGYPCSGKSSLVRQLVGTLRHQNYDVLVIPEPALQEAPCATGGSAKDIRSEIYADSNKERELRGFHKSEIERALTGRNGTSQKGDSLPQLVVIMDAPNYIKGYRYELYCLAKSMKHQHAVLLCDTPADKCMQWNETIGRYSQEVISDMITRFEPPQASNRWDSPLLVFQPDCWPCAEKIDCSSVVSELKALVLNVDRSTIKPNRSTILPAVSPDSFLQLMEHITQLVVDHILSSQSAGAHTVGLPRSIHPSSDTPDSRNIADFQLPLAGRERPFSLADLARAKRRYIAMQRAKLTDSHLLPDATALATSFMGFLVGYTSG